MYIIVLSATDTINCLVLFNYTVFRAPPIRAGGFHYSIVFEPSELLGLTKSILIRSDVYTIVLMRGGEETPKIFTCF